VPSGSGDAPRLTFAEVAPVLGVIASGPEELVLVGGQAVNFWAEFYAPRVPELRAEAPFTSGDIDLVGREASQAAPRIARALGGSLRKPTIYERTATLAVVAYRDGAGDERLIDFMQRLWRLDAADIERTSLEMRPRLRVMHPVLCLESRVHNCLDFAEYQTPEGYSQARAATICAREFLRDALDTGEIRAVLRLNERIYNVAHERAKGCAKHGLRPFDAVLVDPRLPEEFLTLRYPGMRRAVEDAKGLARRTQGR
jgi:hypothetical protein